VHPLLRDFLLKEFGRRDSDAFVECNQLALGVARTKGWWDDAFETGRRLGPEAAVSVIVDASQHYLAEGRVETLAKWLELVQHEAAISPEAQIVRAEIALRLNRFEEAHSIAAAVADSAPDTDPLSSRAWQLSGQASYWLGAEERALREADRAVAVAHTAADRQRALWHAYLAAQGLELPSVDGYLSALEAESDASSTTRLRVAVGRVIANTRRGTFAGASEVMDRSSALIERESDPWVVSSFLAHWSYVKLSAGQYERAVALAREASTQARNLRLALPLHACLSYLAFAELGRRRFQAADQLHRELTYLAQPFDDPHFALMTRIVGVKLALMRGTRPREELDLPCAAESSKSGTAAELEAVGALAAAVDGDSSLSHEKLARATSLSQGVECFLYCAFTEAVLAQQTHAQSEARRRFVEAIEEARVRECLDALILAYRAWPHLLGLVPEEEAEVRAIIEQALALGADSRLAARYGYRIGGLHPVKSVLTRRENEVLRLMAGGLTNVQIAEKLVISHSTAKVHVSNILRKLGVKNRLEAIRRYESVEP
jgi:DNA-binding NarL/FixJ family response regulator